MDKRELAQVQEQDRSAIRSAIGKALNPDFSESRDMGLDVLAHVERAMPLIRAARTRTAENGAAGSAQCGGCDDVDDLLGLFEEAIEAIRDQFDSKSGKGKAA